MVTVRVISHFEKEIYPVGLEATSFCVPADSTYSKSVHDELYKVVKMRVTHLYEENEKLAPELIEEYKTFTPESIIWSDENFSANSGLMMPMDMDFVRTETLFGSNYLYEAGKLGDGLVKVEDSTTFDKDAYLSTIAEKLTSIYMGPAIAAIYTGGVYIVSKYTDHKHIGGQTYRAEG